MANVGDVVYKAQFSRHGHIPRVYGLPCRTQNEKMLSTQNPRAGGGGVQFTDAGHYEEEGSEEEATGRLLIPILDLVDVNTLIVLFPNLLKIHLNIRCRHGRRLINGQQQQQRPFLEIKDI